MGERLIQYHRFIGELSPDAALRPVILDSWRRSRSAGVERTPVRLQLRHVGEKQLARRLADNAELLEVARPHLEWLSASFAAIAHVAYLVDRDGVVLYSTGTDQNAVRDFGLSPGFDWRESIMGTNGAGTALASGLPISVAGAEHFSSLLAGAWCTGAPIRGSDDAIIGAIDVSTTLADGLPDRLMVVAHAAYTIGQELAQLTTIRQAERDLAAHRDRAEARLRLMQELTVALGSPYTYAEIVDIVSSRVFTALGAEGGSLLVRDPAGATCQILQNAADPQVRPCEGCPIPSAALHAVPDDLRDGRAAPGESLRAWSGRCPAVAAECGVHETMELQLVPCELDGRTLGVLALKFPRPREFTPEEQTFATAIAQQCAQALDRVRLCLAEKKARSEAEAANGAKSRFLNLVSHELRTPLNAIGGYAALMQEGIPDPVTPGQQNYLMRIQTAQRHLLSLVTNILNLARIEAGRLEYCLTEVLVQDLWSAVEQLIGVQLRVKGLEFCLTPVDPALAVIADREKALEVLLNLVGNSLKFTGRGGSIAVEAEARDDTVDLRVRDTGIGIPPERLTTIFEPFEQGEKHQTRAAEGVGLGLTISRELARGMGGELRAESTPGLGSVFTLTLPRAGRE